jgi:hypothetical protein
MGKGFTGAYGSQSESPPGNGEATAQAEGGRGGTSRLPEVPGSPAVSSLRPVAFRPCLTAGLACAGDLVFAPGGLMGMKVTYGKFTIIYFNIFNKVKK